MNGSPNDNSDFATGRSEAFELDYATHGHTGRTGPGSLRKWVATILLVHEAVLIVRELAKIDMNSDMYAHSNPKLDLLTRASLCFESLAVGPRLCALLGVLSAWLAWSLLRGSPVSRIAVWAYVTLTAAGIVSGIAAMVRLVSKSPITLNPSGVGTWQVMFMWNRMDFAQWTMLAIPVFVWLLLILLDRKIAP